MKSKHRHFQFPTYASISLVHENINEKVSFHTKVILTRKIKQPIFFIRFEVIHKLIFELKRG